MFNTLHGKFGWGRIPGIISNISVIPNNQLWYEASVSSTTNFNVAPANGDDISQWKDKSGNGHNANKSGNASVKPNWYSNVQNGYGVIRFNGTSESLNINPINTFMASQTAFTLFVVAKASSLSGNRCLVSTETNGYRIYFNGTNYQVQTAGGTGVSSLTGDTTSFHVFSLLFDGAQTGNANRLKFRYDGVDQSLNFGATTVGTATNATATTYYIGIDDTNAAGYWNGDIGSIVLYTRALTSNEILGVEDYLMNYWGI